MQTVPVTIPGRAQNYASTGISRPGPAVYTWTMGSGTVAEAMDASTHRVDVPLYIVTVGAADQEKSGCLAGFVTQCSIRPPRFLVCLSKLNHTFFVGERATGIALHLLGDDQPDLARLFADRTGDTYDKFEHCDWHRGTTGAPVLAQCAAWLEGTVLDRHSVGDHEALVMAPTGGGAGRHGGLLTLRNAPAFHPGHPEEP